MHKCPKCSNSYESLNSLRIHAQKLHKLSSENLFLNLFLNGIKQLCACGCQENVKFNGLIIGYSKFAWGHQSRINNNWGHNDKALKNSQEIRREMWKNGEIVPWCKGLTKEDPRIRSIIEKMNTKERGDKISKSLTGKKKSKEHVEKITDHMRKFWAIEENKQKQSERHAKSIQDGMLTRATKVNGYFSNHKKATNEKIYYRSLFELNAILFLEKTNNIISYTYEPYRLSYKNNSGNVRTYVVDFIVTYDTGKQIIVEIKPNCFTNVDRYAINKHKFDAARKYAEENNMTFEVWTEKTHPFLKTPLDSNTL